MPGPAHRADTWGVDEDITCERCGSGIKFTVGETGWPVLPDAALTAHAHGECLRTDVPVPSAGRADQN